MKSLQPRNRRGSLLVVVMGMIILMLGLTIGLASRVSKGIKDSSTIQRQAQAHIMMLNAKIALLSCYDKSTTSDLNSGITLGDGPYSSNKIYLDRLGWSRIKGPATSSTAACQVIAAGGGGGRGGGKTASLDSGNAIANAFDIRYMYTISATFAATSSTFSVTQSPVQDNSNYIAAW